MPATSELTIFFVALVNCTQKAAVRNAKHYKFTSRGKIKEKFVSQMINIVVQNFTNVLFYVLNKINASVINTNFLDKTAATMHRQLQQ